MTLTILGLGPGSVDDLTRRAWQTLTDAPAIYLRTRRHPCVPHLPHADRCHSFDDVYDTLDDFEQVYAAISERVLAAAATGDVVYAVPGDPFVGESTTARLLAGAESAGIETRVVHGLSFVEPSLALAGVDALDGLQVLDALQIAAMYHPPINPDYPALIGQVYSRQVASDVKLTLMNQYADDFSVQLIHGAGTAEGHAETLPLYEIDRSPHIDHLTSLYVPALGGMTSFEHFQEIIAHLRSPEGCPWDRKQTHESLRQFLLEEAYEVLEAIDSGDTDELYKELGDLLLQIVLHTQIAIDDGEFHMTDVLRHVNEKMVRRHPHVWSSVEVAGADDVVTNWTALKQQEKAANGQATESELDGISRAMPALLVSYLYQERAARVGFDWPVIGDVRAKLDEEMDEVLAALDDPDHAAEELGDVLFVLVNWARWLKIEPENALRGANAKFYRRFRHVEQSVAATGRPMTDFTLDELEGFWQEAKLQGL